MDLSDNVRLADKRVSERVRVHWRLLVLLANGDKKPGYAVDISEAGMRLASIHAFPVGSLIRIAVFVPDAQKHGEYLVTQIDCRVVYQVLKEAEVCLGLEFVNPPEEARRRIRAAIAMKQQWLR